MTVTRIANNGETIIFDSKRAFRNIVNWLGRFNDALERKADRIIGRIIKLTGETHE